MKQIEALKEYHSATDEYGVSVEECKCLRFDAGETIIRFGERGTHLYFLVSGVARVQVCSPDGNMLSLSYSISEGVLGEVELMGGAEASSTAVIAETDLICLAYPYQRAKVACAQNMRFVNRIARDLALKLDRSTRSLLDASFASAGERMCAYLCREAEEGVYRGTLARAAEATGVSYRHLQRLMKQLCAEGMLRKEDCGYRVLDMEKLSVRARKDGGFYGK